MVHQKICPTDLQIESHLFEFVELVLIEQRIDERMVKEAVDVVGSIHVGRIVASVPWKCVVFAILRILTVLLRKLAFVAGSNLLVSFAFRKKKLI